jgi:ketosteroid isomerase-like protein
MQHVLYALIVLICYGSLDKQVYPLLNKKMKNLIPTLICISLLLSCGQKTNTNVARDEVFQAEKAFAKMAGEKGLAEAFYHFADENAVIKRGTDSLISGKENIRNFYEKNRQDGKLSWTPDFIGISECGTLAYTYGQYIFSRPDSSGKMIENRGIFHTVWKKKNNEWKYVWD